MHKYTYLHIYTYVYVCVYTPLYTLRQAHSYNKIKHKNLGTWQSQDLELSLFSCLLSHSHSQSHCSNNNKGNCYCFLLIYFCFLCCFCYYTLILPSAFDLYCLLLLFGSKARNSLRPNKKRKAQ